MRQLFAPGLEGGNITLIVDPFAVAAMPGGYRWSVIAADSSEDGGRASTPAWVIAVVVGVGAAAAAGFVFLWVQHRRRSRMNGLGGMGKGSCRGCKQDPGICPPPQQDKSSSGRVHSNIQLLRDSLGGVQLKQQSSLATSEQLDTSLHVVESAERILTALPQSSSIGTSSSLISSTVSAGLNNWRMAVNHTMLTIMQRRLEAQAPSFPGGGVLLPVGNATHKPVGVQAVPVVKAHGAARAGGLIPRAAPMVLLEGALGRVSDGSGMMSFAFLVSMPSGSVQQIMGSKCAMCLQCCCMKHYQ